LPCSPGAGQSKGRSAVGIAQEAGFSGETLLELVQWKRQMSTRMDVFRGARRSDAEEDVRDR